MTHRPRKHLWLLAGLALTVPGGASAQLSRLSPLSELKLSHVTDRLVQIDKAPYRMYALNTSAGIVFIDTEPTPADTRAAMALAQKEFNRKDIAWLINTHDHLDHLLGNAAFAGTPIVTSEGTLQGLIAAKPRMKGFIEQAEQTLAKARAERDSMPKGSPAYDSATRRIEANEAIVANGRADIVLPAVTFTDRMTLHVGDRTIRLVAAGQRHSIGDMLIHIPEEHVLFTVGTANPVGYIPYLTDITRPQDIKRVVAVFTEFSDTALGLTHVLTGHGAELKREDVVFARDYYAQLWKDLARVRGEGATLEQAQQQLALETAFKGILPPGAVPEASKKTHSHNVEVVWKLQEPTPAAEKAAPR